MSTVLAAAPQPAGAPDDEVLTVADLLHRLGGISPSRVRVRPAPGTATVADVPANKLCELVDGTLVEKAMGASESRLAIFIGHLFQLVVLSRNLGTVLGADGSTEILTGLVRLPDVAFLSWDRLPGRRMPSEPVPAVVPDSVVEVVSISNTAAEMTRKRDEYFRAGVRLVWMVDRFGRTVTVYTAVDRLTALTGADVLDGGAVLPGFAVPVRDVFAELDRHG